MKGTNDYCMIFKKAEQVGRLYILPSSHARGLTFRIYVLPDSEKVIENGGHNPPLNNNSVEVYGVISGQRGWTESYGWLHEGIWQEDFKDIYDARKLKYENNKSKFAEKYKLSEQERKRSVKKLLDSYE